LLPPAVHGKPPFPYTVWDKKESTKAKAKAKKLNYLFHKVHLNCTSEKSTTVLVRKSAIAVKRCMVEKWKWW
jgi:hypothetical protein